MTLSSIIGAQEIIVILMVAAFVFLIPIWALVDIVRGKFKGNMQLIWVIIVVCLNLIGAVLYFGIGKNQKR